jgi:sulfopyruvate decarboxylase TPP-binding subunit
VVWLVDTETASLSEALQAAQNAGSLQVIPVCREGEAIPVAMGLLFGAKKPVVIIQNTGFYESGDALRALAIDFHLPIVLMIGYRGWKPVREEMVDTAGIYIEPVLQAYGVPFEMLSAQNVSMLVAETFRLADERSGPVAILVPGEWRDA